MKKILFLLLTFAAVQLHAQRTKNALLEDSIFAWKPMATLVPSKYPWAISAAQQKLPALFFDWIKKSHQLTGAVNKTYALAEPNKKDEVLAFAVGVNAAVWKAEWDKSGKMVKNQPHSEVPIQVLTNYIIDAQPISLLTIPGRPVFTRRSPNPEETFKNWDYGTRLIKQFQLEKNPQIGKYIIQYYGCTGDMCQPLVAVYLAPNNKLPIRQLTRGEVLDMCEAAIPGEIKRLLGEPIKVDNNYLKEKYNARAKELETIQIPKWKANIKKLRKQYRNSLNEPAFVRNVKGIHLVNLENGDDLFEISNTEMFGIYTYEAGVLENSKKDKPLWICINWMPVVETGNVYSREFHHSMTQFFNFDYVYNYFFNPEKVKGQPYTIRNPEEYKQTASRIKNNAPVKTNSGKLASGVYFADDFLDNSVGSKPKGWFMPGTGKPSVIAQPAGFDGNWVAMGQYRLAPYGLKGNLPENFKMEFDVATDKDFAENTGGAFLLRIHNMLLTPGGDYKNAPKQILIELDAKAGNEKFSTNPTGYARLKATYTGMNNTNRYADVLQYSNDFSNKKSKVHFTIIKSGKKVSAFIDGKEITALDKYGKPVPGFNELPEGARFTSFYFENITNYSSKQVGIYIANIRITEKDNAAPF
ncbi:MAG TPA: hypothetical protein PKV73_00025 [Agriterribacter sp.]|nr:hypothetical protein [Chitinophagaceae bacterium]HRP30237.1 hypothetical protein [Agriterribacter sp.]